MAVTELLDDTHVGPRDIGATLRSARESAGFSVTDVAERLRLSRHHIENLEAERFDLFPVAVFLRGYLTSYARLLGIDADPLLEEYDRRGFGPPQLHSQDTSRESPRSSEFTVTVTTIVVIAVLIVLSALWWREQWSGEEPLTNGVVERPEGGFDSPGTEPGTDAPVDEIVFPEPAPVVPAGEDPAGSGEGTETAAAEAGARAPDAGATGEDTAPGAPGAGSVAVAPDAATEPESPVEPVSPGAGTAGTSPAGTPGEDDRPAPAEAGAGTGNEATTAAAEPAADEGEGEAGDAVALVIRIREDCWLMIRDADQRLVFRDIAAAGTVLDLSVIPPVRVVAGYASGIDVEYGGVPFDLSPFVEEETGTARFRLGG